VCFLNIFSFAVMKRNSLISGLQLKFAQRSWNDTLLLVQRCMEKSRIESKPCEPLVRSLERLQDVSVTRSRLEMIAQQQGMGFHVTEDTCYLTADLFYLEVLLPPCGGVQEVKVALHGEGPVVNFAAFSTRLKDLFIQYNIPGDNEIKLKLLESLQFLVRDLQKMSGENLPRGSCPVGAPLSEVPGEMLPACFLLRLKPPVPVLSSFVEKLSLITDVAVAQTDQQWAPLHRLLMAGSQSAEETSDQLDLFTVLLPDGETQRYVFPGASWDAPEQRASVVEAVSFTHPAQVPALLQLLRHQCAVNALLRSCWASQSAAPGGTWVLPCLFGRPHEEVRLVSTTFKKKKKKKFLFISVLFAVLSFLSIPATMKMLLSRLETASPSYPKSRPTSADEDPPALMEVSQNAAVPEDSVSKTEVNPNPSVTSHLCSPVGTFAQQAEL
uniref:Mediator of RNA polymerase II transcription subunit 1 n=1 Tax=Oryzias latipes TaxID=8090 RepID=A0A3P9K552_ORYLA